MTWNTLINLLPLLATCSTIEVLVTYIGCTFRGYFIQLWLKYLLVFKYIFAFVLIFFFIVLAFNYTEMYLSTFKVQLRIPSKHMYLSTCTYIQVLFCFCTYFFNSVCILYLITPYNYTEQVHVFVFKLF